MGLIFKAFFAIAFTALIYVASTKLISLALEKGLPELPTNVAYFVHQSGLDNAITIYISIISAGWVVKQLLAYMRSFG